MALLCDEPPCLDIEEGGPCPAHGCAGHMQIEQDPCYCAATHAPCSNCTNSTLMCDECLWSLEDDLDD